MNRDAKETTANLAGELESYRQQILAIKRDAIELTERLSEAEFDFQPQVGAWSIGECLAHLNQTNFEYFPPTQAAINIARENKIFGREPFKHNWLGNFFIKQIEPPVRRKLKSPRKFQPSAQIEMRDTIERFLIDQERVLKLIDEASGLDLARVEISSPVTRLLKFSLGQVFALTCAHERRHLWQAREVSKVINRKTR